MELTLNALEEWFVTSISWDQMTNLIVQVEDAAQEQYIEVRFRQVCFHKALVSNASQITRDNEIWKFEEILGSPLLSEVTQEQGGYWLRQLFGDGYQTQRTYQPTELRHMVLLSDYIHLEVLCTEFEVKQIKDQSSRSSATGTN